MRKISDPFVYILFVLFSLSIGSAYSQNILTNGDFESGGSGVGFMAGGLPAYSLATIAGTSVPGNYAFVTNPQSLNSSFNFGGDHSSGTGRMMVVDGSTLSGLNFFWTAGSTGGAVNGFVPGKRYRFSYWIKSVSNDVTNTTTQAEINFFYAPGDILPTSVVPAALNIFAPLPAIGWQQVSYEFTANDTAILFRLFNNNKGSTGNNFAIDDMSVVCASLPLLNITNPATVCSSSTVDLTQPSVTLGSDLGALSYYTDAAATIPLLNPNAVTIANTYYIKNTASLGCETIKPVVVTIAPPIASPIVTTPINLCLTAPTALMATQSPGHTLKWYGTAATGGTASSIATIPSATGTYYVSQTDGVCESSRVPIQVNLVADTGASIVGFYCNVLAPLPDGTRSVIFDWGNDSLAPGATYNYIYTIVGGLSGSGSTTNAATNATISGVQPGQSVSLTITSLTQYPCVLPQTRTCSAPCGTSAVIPTFNPVPIYCQNAPVVLPTTSTNTNPITGSWSPSTVDTSAPGTTMYTFTPDSILFPCAKTTTLNISVKSVEPDFTDFSICFGDTATPLSNVSPNGYTGTWIPSSIDNSISKSYDFTPDPGQPCTPSNKTINVTVNPSNVILSLNWTVTEAFSKNQIVTVTDPLGSNYLYQMDFGPFQTSPVFENVSSGLHSISVKHVNGCSEFTQNNVLIIGYPKFFTPNGDGYNDTWNIPGLKDQLNSRIHIFDRYGKLLKDINPNDPGWDGTYIGQPMPADDYWFNVEYIENAVLKKFKSHFSLKR